MNHFIDNLRHSVHSGSETSSYSSLSPRKPSKGKVCNLHTEFLSYESAPLSPMSVHSSPQPRGKCVSDAYLKQLIKTVVRDPEQFRRLQRNLIASGLTNTSLKETLNKSLSEHVRLSTIQQENKWPRQRKSHTQIDPMEPPGTCTEDCSDSSFW